MDKNGNITLSYDTWKDGIKTPITGMEDICNIDIFDKPGVAKIDFRPTVVLSETDAEDTPTAYTCCSIQLNGDAILGDDDGNVYSIDESTYAINSYDGTTAGNFQNSVYWKGYTIFTSYDVNTDTIKLSAFATSLGGDSIEPNFESMASDTLTNKVGDFRFGRGALCVGIDDILYVGSGKYVGSLTEDTTFDPTDGGTYTWNNNALDLPDGYQIDTIINLNEYLMIIAGNPNTREQAIFPWDRVSASYEYPIPLNNGVSATAITKENLVYFLDGIRGQFRVTNRSLVEKITEFENISFPRLQDGIAQKSGTIAVLDDVFTMGVSNERAGVSPVGVYRVKGNSYTRQTLSEGLDGSTKEIQVQFITPFKYNNYLVGWKNVDDDTFSVDMFGKDDYRYSSYSAFMISPLYQVSGSLKKKSYQQIEVSLAKELATGQGIKIYYRKNLTDDWTLIQTFDYLTYGAQTQFNGGAKIIDVSTVQLKIELTTDTNSTTTPELIAVRLF